MQYSANTTLNKIAKSVRRFFVGEVYTATMCLNGYGIVTCKITAPNMKRAMEEAEEIADVGVVLSCELSA